ncbi:MAG: hypothetical protein U0984_03405, partial [Prosthecobacter sp.]|nr:hypothetical protein [Prosthecobacter sp.]
MNIALRPSTLRVLEAFRLRRQRLLWYRAGLSLLAVALAGFLVIALLDRVRFMPEVVRPWVTLLVYVGGVWAAWKAALKFLPLARDEAGVARLVESAAPALRERMLAAVELAQGHGNDSAEFRARLQDQVAAEVGGLDLTRVLPGRSLRPWVGGILALVALTVGLSFNAALHVPGFLMRAVVPFANLARPSSVKITIVQPAPASTLAPFASEDEVAAEITGLKDGATFIETQTAGGRVQRRELKPAGGTRHEGLIVIGQTDLRYRLLAGDSITSWQNLTARARPRVTEFVKVIVPPAYSGLPEKKVTEDYGDIEALEGSTVKLSLKTNQRISQGELRFNVDQPNPPAPKPVQPGNDGALNVEMLVRPEIASWQMVLTSEETGFTNEESSPWQISAIPDLPPVVQITEPVEQLELIADESVRLSGIASDDVGIAAVKMAHSINGAGWQEKELVGKSGAEAVVQSLLPLGPLNVKPGDTVILKLIAIDLKGQRAESTPVRTIILEQTVDPRQRQWAVETRRLAQAAQTLNEETRELTKVAQQVQKGDRRDKKKPEDKARAEDALTRAQSGLEQITERANDLWEQLKEAARSAPTHLDAAEVQLLGERVSQMRRESLAEMKQAIEQPTANVETLRRAAGEATSHASVLAQAAQVFATEDSAKILAQSAQHLQRQENLLTDNALPANRDASQRPQWQEQQRAAIAATESTRKEMEALKAVADGGAQRQLDELSKQVAEAASDMRESLDKPEQAKSPEHLYGASDNLRQRLGRTAAVANAIADNAANQAAQARERLQRLNDPAMAALEQARAALQNALGEAKDKRPKPPKLDREGNTALQHAEKELAQAAKQLEDQAALREQTPMTNDQAALDTNRTSRAADKLAQEVKKLPAQQTPESISAAQEKTAQLVEAMRALKADALAQSAMKASEAAAANPDPTKAASPTQPADEARAAAE